MVDTSNNSYDFILNPEKPPKQPMINLGGGGMFKRALVVGIGLILLIILFVVVTSFLGSAGKAQGQKLLGIAQTQTEILRVAEAAKEKIRDRDLLFMTENVKLSITSSRQELIQALSTRGIKAQDKQLALGQNQENDSLLLQGEQNGKFDETYRALLQQQLNNYKLALQDAHSGATANEKQAIEKSFNQIDLILGKKS